MVGFIIFFNSVCCATPLSRNLPWGQSEQLYETCSDRCVHIVYVMKHSDMFVFFNICYFVMKRQQCISPRVLSLNPDILPSKPLHAPPPPSSKELKNKTTRFVIYSLMLFKSASFKLKKKNNLGETIKNVSIFKVSNWLNFNTSY